MKDVPVSREMMCQLLTLGMCLESPARATSMSPGDFLDGELGAVLHDLQQLAGNRQATTLRLDAFLPQRCGVARTGKISDSIAAQVAIDRRTKQLLETLRRYSAGRLGESTTEWIEEVKRAIGNI